MAETTSPSHIEQIFREVWQKHRADIIAQSGGKTTETWDEKALPQLVILLNRHFNEEELRTFTFELAEDYDSLPSQGKEAKTRELVTKFFRHGRLTELVKHAKEVRRHVSWDTEVQHIAKRWEQVDWAESAQEYSKFIQAQYSKMRVLGKPELVPLEGIFTDVYILDKPSAWRRFSREDLQTHYVRGEPFESGAKRQAGLDIILQVPKLFILGKPGAGKTTFLKYLALQAVNGSLPKVPVFISLKELADKKQGIAAFMIDQFKVCDWPHAKPFVGRLLKEGQVIVLLDGLDEVSETQAERSNLTARLQRFTQDQRYIKNQFIITCRVAATDYSFEQFTYGEMADFAPVQVETFVQKWFVADIKKGQSFLTELKKREHEGLRELAQTPLLLVLLCLAFEENYAFPQRRVGTYKDAIEALLKKWDASRNIRRDGVYHHLPSDRKQQMLARIAYDTFHKGNYFIPKTELARWIEVYLRGVPGSSPGEVDGEAILQAIEAQHGILIERAQGVYSFAHLTFQEYFTAQYIVENVADGTLHRLCQFVMDHRWREVFLLTASSLNNARHLFDLLLKYLEGMVRRENLTNLLAWAAQKAKDGGLPTGRLPLTGQRLNRRILYIFLALNLDRALALDPTCALALARTCSLTLDHTLDYALDLARTLDRIRVLGLDRALGLDRVRVRDLDRALAYTFHPDHRTLDQDIGLDFALGYALLVAEVHYVGELFNKAIEWSQALNLPELHHALIILKILGEKAPDKVWQQFCADLRRILQTHRQLEQKWQFTREELKILEDYLTGNELLVECLKLAYVPDRQAIEDRLLLPPVVKGEG